MAQVSREEEVFLYPHTKGQFQKRQIASKTIVGV